jgi:hypothetical protein
MRWKTWQSVQSRSRRMLAQQIRGIQADLAESLETRGKRHCTLYENAARIEREYGLRRYGVQVLQGTVQTGGQLGIALAKVLGIQVQVIRGWGIEQEIPLSAKAVLIELDARREERLSNPCARTREHEDELYVSTGNGTFAPLRPADPPNAPDELTRVVEVEYLEQQSRLKVVAPDQQMVALMIDCDHSVKGRPTKIAVVAAPQSITADWMSYGGQGRYGVLGRQEKRAGDVLFLEPFWIWRDRPPT